MSPKVSIVLPTYNGERYLESSIRSCLAQTYSNLELIVVVDGSTDGTLALLDRFDDPRIRVRATQNQGLPTALNTGFGMATGALWTWTSDDNLYFPEAIETMVALAAASGDFHHVCADFWVLDGKDRVKGYNRTSWACFLYPAEMAAEIGEYRAAYPLVEDVDFFLRLTHRFGAFTRHHHPLYLYREHGASLSARFAGGRSELSLRLHLAHWREGIVTTENYDLKQLFVSRIEAAALHGDAQTCLNILEIGRDLHLFFLPQLETLAAARLSLKGRLLLKTRARLLGLRHRLDFYRLRKAQKVERAVSFVKEC